MDPSSDNHHQAFTLKGQCHSAKSKHFRRFKSRRLKVFKFLMVLLQPWWSLKLRSITASCDDEYYESCSLILLPTIEQRTIDDGKQRLEELLNTLCNHMHMSGLSHRH